MKVWFGQIYIEPGVSFPFSWCFQQYLSKKIMTLIVPSPTFVKKYGSDSELMFRISAKNKIEDNEIRGPTVFKNTKDVEYTIFLPFDAITRRSETPKVALRFLLKGVCSVFESLDIDTTKIVEKQELLIEHICSDPKMFEEAS